MLQPVIRISIFQTNAYDKANQAINQETKVFNTRVFQFYKAISCKIDSSWDNLIQTAQVVLPRRIRRINYMDYNQEDFKNMKTNIFTESIEGYIRQQRKYLYISDSTISDSTTNKLWKYNPASLVNYSTGVNNGKHYDKNGYRLNPLIQRGDIIVIQLGYNIFDKVSKKRFNTISNGNVGFNNIFSVKTPSELAKSPLIHGENGDYFDISNRWKPYNRGFQFKGIISKTSIDNDGNIVLACEDMMYLINRSRIPNNTYASHDNRAPNGKGWTLNSIIQDLLSKVVNYQSLPMSPVQATNEDGSPNLIKPYSINMQYNHDCQLPLIKISGNQNNATIGDVFRKIKDEYNIPICLRSNTDILVSTPFVYNNYFFNFTPGQSYGQVETATYSNDKIGDIKIGYSNNKPSSGQTEFIFITGVWNLQNETAVTNYLYGKNLNIGQSSAVSKKVGWLKNRQNIIKSNLEFKRVDDNLVGATVKSQFKIDLTKLKNGVSQPVMTQDARPVHTPVEHAVHVGDYGGIDYTFFYLVTTENLSKVSTNGQINTDKLNKEMVDHGTMMLSTKNYTGLFGSFTTYGYPYVQFSDIVNIVDLSFPERCGRYYVKRVLYKMDAKEGLSQEIFIDYRIPDKPLTK